MNTKASEAGIREQKKVRHIFALAAYGESPYLEEQLKSLYRQSVKSPVIMCTSTPNTHIRGLCEKYAVPLLVREGQPGLADDWNFAFEEGAKRAQLVTIAHQDDRYHPDYVKALLHAYRWFPDLSLFCCRYETIDAEGRHIPGISEYVKRILRLPLRFHEQADRTFVKLLPLRFGNGIGCPTCTYNTAYCEPPLFRNKYRFVTDWDTLVRLAGLPGRFICVERPLLQYRIHAGAETMRNIRNHNREAEEREMFVRLHGRVGAEVLMGVYRVAALAYR